MEGPIFGILAGLLIATVFNSIILWIVGKLGLGLEIDKFGTAFFASFLIAVIGVVLSGLTKGITGAMATKFGATVMHVILSAFILLIVDKILPGMKTKGFIGAVIASIAIGLVQWLLGSLVAGMAS